MYIRRILFIVVLFGSHTKFSQQDASDTESDTDEAIAALQAPLQGSEKGTLLERLRRDDEAVAMTNNNDSQGVDGPEFPAGVDWVIYDDFSIGFVRLPPGKKRRRRKRSITRPESIRWDKGIIPYQFNAAIMKNSLTTLSNNLNIIERANGGNWRGGFTGMQEHFKIDREGEITQWQFYSRTPGASELMVWRPTGSSPTTAMTLIGHNRVTTRRNRMQYIDIPAGQRIQVKAGDLIGLWVETGTGIPYDDCRGSYSIALNGWYNPNTFVTGNQYPFRSDYRCRVYSLKAKIEPAA